MIQSVEKSVKLAFKSAAQERVFQTLTSELNSLGYRGELLQQAYSFRDWFSADETPRLAPAAAFGRTPVSYDSACAVVLLANGRSGPALVRDFRALGAPLAFEVHEDRVVEWRVAREPSLDDWRSAIPADALSRVFAEKKNTWSPEAVLRAKNIGPSVTVQLDFCDLGLIPALEENIRAKLDPLLRNVLADAQADYQSRTTAVLDPRALFRLAVWSLAGKVFHDRGVAPFSEFTRASEPDDVLNAVATYYDEPRGGLLLKQTRRIVHDQIWTKLDFSNISVDVLAHVWLNTFVTKDVREKLGIHQTPRSVARYILQRLPIEAVIQSKRPIIEPCCGSATFLIAALHRLREILPGQLSPKQRHAAMKKLLVGYEADPFAVEISRLSLTLADFPNPNGWQLNEADVFASQDFDEAVARASVVVCNPPYGDFSEEERAKYRVDQVHKPAELLRRLLTRLPHESSVGFVLPWRFLDGMAYRDIRTQLVERWESIEIVNLPEVAFATADQATLLLIATAPKLISTNSTRVAHRRITQREWSSCEALSYVGRADQGATTSAQAAVSLGVKELSAVWESLSSCSRLEDHATVHRGIEWNQKLRENGQETENRARLVRDSPKDGYREGYPPLCDVSQFQRPPTKFLSTREEDVLYKAHLLPWNLPKVFVNAVRKSRGRWRIAAFADERNILCYQNLTSVWPSQPEYLHVIEAALNGPVANAYVATVEEKHIRVATLKTIPMPRFDAIDRGRLVTLTSKYRELADSPKQAGEQAAMLLREIDAVVLKGYGLPADRELELLRWFRGSQRAVPDKFESFFPPYADVGISLKDFVDVESHWADVNERRLDLIDRELEGRITKEEEVELERLQALADVKFRPLHQEAMRRLDAEIGSTER